MRIVSYLLGIYHHVMMLGLLKMRLRQPAALTIDSVLCGKQFLFYFYFIFFFFFFFFFFFEVLPKLNSSLLKLTKKPPRLPQPSQLRILRIWRRSESVGYSREGCFACQGDYMALGLCGCGLAVAAAYGPWCRRARLLPDTNFWGSVPASIQKKNRQTKSTEDLLPF